MREEIWNRNIESLDERYAKLKEQLLLHQNEEQNSKNGITYGISEVEDKRVLYAIKDEKTYQLDTLYDSDTMMNLWVQGQKTIGYNTKCIFCGLGNGMYVRKILQDCDDTMQVLVYEPDFELIRFVLGEFDLSDILTSNRFTLIVEDLFEKTYHDYLYQLVRFEDLNKLIYQTYPNYSRIMSDAVKAMDGEIQILLNSIRASQSVLARHGARNYQNSIFNSPWFQNSKSITDFYTRCPKNIPLFIVSSGPSLDKNIKELNRIGKKGILLAADSAVPALMKENIIPDLIITIDAVKNIKHFQDERTREIPVICQLESNSSIIRMRKGYHFFINDLNPYVNRFVRDCGKVLPVFSTGGSVANTACAIAFSMGFEKIILVGQDLAYTDGKTHASATVRGSVNTDTDALAGYMTEGYYGGQVKTSYEFQLYKKWFEEEIVKNPDCKVYNATEGGAKIQGAENITLSDAVERLCVEEIQLAQIIEETELLLANTEQNAFKQYMYALYDHFEKLQRMTDSALRAYQKLYEMAHEYRMKKNEMMRILDKTAQTLHDIEKADAFYYISCLIQKDTSQILENVNEEEENPREQILATAQKGINYMNMIKNAIDLALNQWDEKGYFSVKAGLDFFYEKYDAVMCENIPKR